jgi:ABC-type Fe3+/spermidine/putrescine transport system ATPase subunit
MDGPWLEIDVAKRFPGFALEAKLEAKAPFLSLFGPSGAGKTLLLSMVAGLVRPDRGRIVLGGRVLFDRAAGVDVPAQDRRAGLVFQSHALFPHMTVEDNLRFGLPGARRGDPRVRDTARTLGLEARLGAAPSTLSGGERQRTALGRALLAGPETVLLDEPFNSLDAPERERVRGETLEFLRARGIPYVLVTHDLEEAFLSGGEIAVLGEGKVQQAGPREDVFQRPCNELVAGLMAVRNFLRASVLERDGDLVRASAGPALLTFPAPDLPPGATEALVGIRPDNVRILAPGRADPKPNRLEGTIVSESFTGLQHDLVLEVAAPAGAAPLRLRASIPDYPYRRMELAAGMRVAFYLPPRCLQIIR